MFLQELTPPSIFKLSYAWDETAQKLKILEETEERGSPNTNKK